MSDNNNMMNNSHQQEDVTPNNNSSSSETANAYNYVPDEIGTTTEREGLTMSSNNNNNNNQDISSIAFRESQSFTIDKHFAAYKLYWIGISLFVMLIILIILLGVGGKETPAGSNCANIFNGTCRGFLTLVAADDWQLFGSFVGCPTSQKCVTKVGVDAYANNCTFMQDRLWARPPLTDYRIGSNDYLEKSCCRAVAGTYLPGFGELLLQAFLTTIVAMFLNSPFPLMFFRWVRDKCAVSQVACCCFCGIAFDDEDSRNRVDAWYERKDEMTTRRVERNSLVGGGGGENDDDDEENNGSNNLSPRDSGHGDDQMNNNNTSTNTNNRAAPAAASSASAPSASTGSPFHFTWIDYLFIPSSLYKYKIAVQVVLQSWIALIIAFSFEGNTSPSEHTLGSSGFYRFCAMASMVINGGSFITLVEFLSIVACYHLIELRRTSMNPETHSIDSVSYFNQKLKGLFVTPVEDGGNENKNNNNNTNPTAASTRPFYSRISKPGQWLMWFAMFSCALTFGPGFLLIVLPAQMYFIPWFSIWGLAFIGVFALIFWIADGWFESFYPIYFSNSAEETKRMRETKLSRKMRIFLAVLGRFIVVISVNLIFLSVYLAPINAMIMTYLFGYQGNGYIQVMFDEASVHSDTCSMKYGQAENFGEVLYAILFYV